MYELLELFPTRYVLLIPVLNWMGYMIKHDTRIPNEFIPIILFAVASAVGMSLRHLTTGTAGIMHWLDVVLVFGIVNSLKLTLLSVGGYEAVRAIGFSSRREEVRKVMRRPFIRCLISFAAASVLFSLLAICTTGFDFVSIIQRITDGWVFGIMFLLAFDVISKIAKHRDRINAVYITMCVLVLASIVMFSIASVSESFAVCIGCLAAAVFLGLGAGICIFVPYVREKKEMKEKMLEELSTPDGIQRRWVKVRARILNMDAEKQKKILYAFLPTKLVGDSIYGSLDVESPFFRVREADGSEKAVPYDTAKSLGWSEDALKEAKDYIDLIVETASAREGK